VIAEPFGPTIPVGQLGVLWFDVRVSGSPAHAGTAPAGVNAIEACFPIVRALRALEAELNLDVPPAFAAHERPINLNIGIIEGGDWRSTVAAECVLRCRLALFPGQRLAALRARIEATVAAAAAADPVLAGFPPEVSYDGFAVEGYELDPASELVGTLSATVARLRGEAPDLITVTATTDARALGGVGGIPTACLGPYGERLHGVDERVHLPSVHETALLLALFVRDWCGLVEA
jgi:acetylornithine deacetylase